MSTDNSIFLLLCRCSVGTDKRTRDRRDGHSQQPGSGRLRCVLHSTSQGVSVCIYVYIFVFVCVCVCVCIYQSSYPSVYLSVCLPSTRTPTRMHVKMRKCARARVSKRTHARTHALTGAPGKSVTMPHTSNLVSTH
jgi:hypothetical protein